MVQKNILLNNTQLLQHLASIYRNQRSGILQLGQNHCARKLLFHQGNCITAMSTLPEELPGHFLFTRKIIDQQGYNTYTQKSQNPDMRQWEIATESLQADVKQRRQWKTDYVHFIVAQIIKAQSNAILFEAQTFSHATAILASGPNLLENFIAHIHQEDIYLAQPYLQQSDATVRLTDKFPSTLDDKTSMGLRTIIQNHPILDDVFSHSLLELEPLQKRLLLFSLLGWIKIQNKDTLLIDSFLATLSPSEKEMRQTLLDLHALTDHATYYQLLDVQPHATTAQITQAYSTMQSTVLQQAHQKLFHPTEENISLLLQARSKQAHKTLSTKTTRAEYDDFLQSGSQASFTDTSKTLAAENALAQFQQLRRDKPPKEAAAYAYAFLRKKPQAVALAIMFVEFALTSGEIQNPTYQSFCFDLVKHHIQHNPQRYEPFFLLGKLCLLLQQPDNATKAFTRALETRPDLSSLREYIIEKNPQHGAEIILRAISEKMRSLTYYQLLAASPKNSSKEIHSAYRVCCRYFHPDRFYDQKGEPAYILATDIFKKMAQAYQTLRNIEKRDAYDMQISAHQAGSSAATQRPQPPTHFKAKQHYTMALDDINSQNYEGALVNLRFALQLEPENKLLQDKIAWVKTAKKAH